MPKQINWIDFYLECFKKRKNIFIYTSFGHSRLMVLIDGYDEMVHVDRFGYITVVGS